MNKVKNVLSSGEFSDRGVAVEALDGRRQGCRRVALELELEVGIPVGVNVLTIIE